MKDRIPNPNDELLTDISKLDNKTGKMILLGLAEFLAKGDKEPLETLRILVNVFK